MAERREEGFALALVVILLFAVGVLGATGYQIAVLSSALAIGVLAWWLVPGTGAESRPIRTVVVPTPNPPVTVIDTLRRGQTLGEVSVDANAHQNSDRSAGHNAAEDNLVGHIEHEFAYTAENDKVG